MCLETAEQFCCVLCSGHPESEELSPVITCQVIAVKNSTDAVGLSAGISFFLHIKLSEVFIAKVQSVTAFTEVS